MTATVMPEVRIGEHIRIARERCGFNQGQVADAVGVNQSRVSRWERGKDYPSVIEWARLALVLDSEWFLDLRLLPSGCIAA